MKEKHWSMASFPVKQRSPHRVFDPDAPQSAKILFEVVCDRLGFDMERAMCKDDVRHMLQARGSEADQDLIRKLRLKLGLTKNALLLTAIRVGLEMIESES